VRYPPELAERLSWLHPGDLYDQKQLVDAQQRLAGSGYYDSAYISIDPEGDPAAVPVSYTVTEARRHKVQLGVGYSTDGGPRLSLEHRDNRFVGTTWRANTKLHLDRKAPLAEWQLDLRSLPDADGWRWGGLARYHAAGRRRAQHPLAHAAHRPHPDRSAVRPQPLPAGTSTPPSPARPRAPCPTRCWATAPPSASATPGPAATSTACRCPRAAGAWAWTPAPA
jgi:hypothetical protein